MAFLGVTIKDEGEGLRVIGPKELKPIDIKQCLTRASRLICSHK